RQMRMPVLNRHAMAHAPGAGHYCWPTVTDAPPAIGLSPSVGLARSRAHTEASRSIHGKETRTPGISLVGVSSTTLRMWRCRERARRIGEDASVGRNRRNARTADSEAQAVRPGALTEQ